MNPSTALAIPMLPPPCPRVHPRERRVMITLPKVRAAAGRLLQSSRLFNASCRSTLLLLPRCPPHQQMCGRAPLWSSTAHLLSSGSSSTCSLVNILLAFFSISRSSPPHYLRAEPPRHTYTRTARAARANVHCCERCVLLVASGQLCRALGYARDSSGPM